MKKLVIFALLLCILLPALSACGQSGPSLHVFNWHDYIDPAVLKEFTKETGIKVKYSRFDDNEKMYAKFTSGTSAYDVIFPSDYMIERMINNGELTELDYASLPNFKNLSNFTLNLPFDAENKYSVPYMWGTLGIVYNTEKVTGTPDSWEILWDSQYKDQIIMIDSVRDAFVPALLLCGYGINDFSDSALSAAKTKLEAQKPLLQSYQLDRAKDAMGRNKAAMAVMYSGDAATSVAKNQKLAYVTPKEGTNIWFDNMVIPQTSTMKDAAHQFIDFLCRQEIAEMNAAYIGYFSPVMGVTEQLIEDGDLPGLLPTMEQMANMEPFRDASDEQATRLDEMWTQIKGR
ncbi:MAG: ABC transporter substrate-binding protein [Clostridia bacterium]|nr:ABC transporter substrate-binding protein [Clostridia bacterium]